MITWITGLFGIGKQWLSGVQEKQKAQLKIELAEKENRARLLKDIESNNHEWEMANLTDKDKFLRRFSFFMFALPFIWAAFDPEAVQQYFDVALGSMPEWYIQLFASIVGGVWGFAALKNTLPSIVNSFKRDK